MKNKNLSRKIVFAGALILGLSVNAIINPSFADDLETEVINEELSFAELIDDNEQIDSDIELDSVEDIEEASIEDIDKIVEEIKNALDYENEDNTLINIEEESNGVDENKSEQLIDENEVIYESIEGLEEEIQDLNQEAIKKSGPSNTYLKGEYMYQKDAAGKESLIKNRWVNIGSRRYYVGSNGKVFLGKNAFKSNGEKYDYYFTLEEGLVRGRDLIADGGKYTADRTGRISLIEKASPGWAGLGDKSYYFKKDGTMLRGFNDLGLNRYYFDNIFGHMMKNTLVKMSDKTLVTDKNGVAKRVGFDYYNGKYTYNNIDGSYKKGLNTIDGKTYFFAEDGDMKRDSYQKSGNQWYYFNKHGEGKKTNGKHKRGWDNYYYYHPDGKLAVGFTYINGYLHYFDDRTAKLQKDTYKAYDNKLYYFNKNGVGSFVKYIPQTRATSGTNGKFRPGYTRNDLGRKTPYYSQNDMRWKNTTFGKNGDKYGPLGCGPTALAMAISRETNRNDIYPTTIGQDVYDYTYWGGTEWQAIREIPARYGLSSYEVPITKEALIQALEDHPVIVRVKPGYFINGGHFMVIDSYKNGRFVINDPYFSIRNTEGSHSFETIKNETTIAWQIK